MPPLSDSDQEWVSVTRRLRMEQASAVERAKADAAAARAAAAARLADLNPQPCSEPTAIHDLAALQAGSLEESSLEQLAGHVVGCRSCKAFLATLIVERLSVEASGCQPLPTAVADEIPSEDSDQDGP